MHGPMNESKYLLIYIIIPKWTLMDEFIHEQVKVVYKMFYWTTIIKVLGYI
jgi:hypothetical protein